MIWKPGMLDQDGCRVVAVGDHGWPVRWATDQEERYAASEAEARDAWSASTPSLHDPATIGCLRANLHDPATIECLLAAAQARYGEALHVRADAPGRWIVYVGSIPMRRMGAWVEGITIGGALLHVLREDT